MIETIDIALRVIIGIALINTLYCSIGVYRALKRIKK